MAESGVETAKNMLRKAVQDGTNICLALLAWWNEQYLQDSMQTSPAQRSMNRRTQRMKPLSPRPFDLKITKKEDKRCREKKQEIMKKNEPKHHSSLPQRRKTGFGCSQ